LGLTTVYVTHDQSEALALSHEIAVMNMGRIVQIGTPRRIYEQPANRFVADFVGASNLVAGVVSAMDRGRCIVRTAIGELSAQPGDGVGEGAPVVVSVRPEDVELSEMPPAPADGDNLLTGTVAAKEFLGDALNFHVRVRDTAILAKVHPSLRTPNGAPVHLRMRAEKCIAIAAEPAPSGLPSRAERR
jgi:iron(III) transport system ATP-binding protein